MAAECEVDHIRVLQVQAGEPLEARVRLTLGLPHWHRPAHESGVGRLVVPIGPLHQPDRHRRAPSARPVAEPAGVGLGVLEVRLLDQAEVAARSERVLVRELREDPERQVLQPALLHVDLDVGAVCPRRLPDRPEARLDGAGRTVRVDRIEVGIERAQLDGDVDPGQRPARGLIQARPAGPAGRHHAQPLHQHQVAPLVLPRLLHAHAGLAQQVEREGLARAARRERRGDRLVGGLGRDEPAREPADTPPERGGDERLAEPARATEAQRHPDEAGEGNGLAAEILAQMLHHLVVLGQDREDVDEPKEPELGRLVAQEPFEERGRRIPLGRHAAQQLPAESADPTLVGDDRATHSSGAPSGSSMRPLRPVGHENPAHSAT